MNVTDVQTVWPLNSDTRAISSAYIAAQTDTTYRPTGLRRQPTTPRGFAWAIGLAVGLAGVLVILQTVLS